MAPTVRNLDGAGRRGAQGAWTRRDWLALATAMALAWRPARAAARSGAAEAPARAVRRFAIQPLTPRSAAMSPRFAADLAFARDALGAFYVGEVRVLPAVAMPESAYYAPRQRHRADILLKWLEGRRLPAVDRLIGVTAADISTTKPPHADWGVLGLATLSGGTCVLSSFRCRLRSRGVEHSRVRFGKVIVHEVGHTLGLPHCPQVGCLMEDARGSVLTTDREYDLCPACRTALVAAGHTLVEDARIPWPHPGATERRPPAPK